MTRLLVSVRDGNEAEAALAAGADILDVKEPRLGALGRPTPAVVNEVLRAVRGRAEVSVALGELRDWSEIDTPFDLPPGVHFAKIGLAGCIGQCDWPRQLGRLWQQFPVHVAPVAVAYADSAAAGSPSAEAVIHSAWTAGCRWLLIDTHVKDGLGLLDHWPISRLADVVSKAQRAGMSVALAGSLTLPAVRRVLSLGPQLIAVRGAVCTGGREGKLDPAAVRTLADLLRRRQAKLALSS